MQWSSLTILISILLLVILQVKVATSSRVRRTMRAPFCRQGCGSCSATNGCVSCQAKLFMLLQRNGMRQKGICLHSCPTGYYGVRRSTLSSCHKCRKSNCDACFSANYCTRCKIPYIAYRGDCLERCPNGLYYANYTKECKPKVDCAVGQWGSWGVCNRNGHTCGYKYGNKTRVRLVLQSPSSNGDSCDSLSETQQCKLAQRWCLDKPKNSSDQSCKRICGRKRLGRRGRKRCRKRCRKRKGEKRKREGTNKGKKRDRHDKDKNKNRKGGKSSVKRRGRFHSSKNKRRHSRNRDPHRTRSRSHLLQGSRNSTSNVQ